MATRILFSCLFPIFLPLSFSPFALCREILSFRARNFHALQTIVCVEGRRSKLRCTTEPSLKLFRNEISRGTKRDYNAKRARDTQRKRGRRDGRERKGGREGETQSELFVVSPALPRRSHTSNCRPGCVAGAYDTFGSVRRLYFSYEAASDFFLPLAPVVRWINRETYLRPFVSIDQKFVSWFLGESHFWYFFLSLFSHFSLSICLSLSVSSLGKRLARWTSWSTRVRCARAR